MKFKAKKPIISVLISVILVALLVLGTAITASAELVNVYTQNSPELTMVNLYEEGAEYGWKPSGTIEQSGKNYTLKTNSWAFWESSDSLDFAYTETPFNTGKGSVLTAEVTLDSWNGEGSGSAGINIRNDLDPAGTGIYLCVRPATLYFMYRKTEATPVNRGIEVDIKDEYPLSLKITVNKSKNNATGYYKIGDGKWVSVGNIPFIANSKLYTGLAAHSVVENVFKTMKAHDFNISLDAPEGYVIEEEGSSSSEDSSSNEPEVILPEDMKPYGDSLLTETFTDGNLFNENKEKDEVTDPLWTVRAGTPNVVLNEDNTNRYLAFANDDEEMMMTAGDMHWTDYSVETELFFPSSDIMRTEENRFTLLVRHKSVVIGGSTEYGVTLVNKFKGNDLLGQYLQLNFRGDQVNYSNRNFFIPQYNTTLAEVCLAEGNMVEADVTHKLKVECFDNRITVYWNGEKLIDHIDEGNYPRLQGNVGIYTKAFTAQMDNLVVRKLTDNLGGDYDNEVGGGFNDPIPDYIVERYGRD